MSQLDCAMVDTVLYERPDPLLAQRDGPCTVLKQISFRDTVVITNT
jgi:hypothetical protein